MSCLRIWSHGLVIALVCPAMALFAELSMVYIVIHKICKLLIAIEWSYIMEVLVLLGEIDVVGSGNFRGVHRTYLYEYKPDTTVCC